MGVADGVKRCKITGRCGLLEPEGGRVVVVMMVVVMVMVVVVMMVAVVAMVVMMVMIIIIVIIIAVMSDVPMQSAGDVSAAAPALH